MKTYTYAFEGSYGITHELSVQLNFDTIFSDTLFELVKDAFLEAKSILEEAIYSFPNCSSMDIFPGKKLVEKVIYYNSNGKYKNFIKYYDVSKYLNGVTKVIIKLNDTNYCELTGRAVEDIAYKSLREPLWWEEYGKKFYPVSHNPELIRTYIREKKIVKCYYYDKPYYFNIGINEPDVTDYMIEEATWFVYE